MAPQPENKQNQRIEQLEESVTDLRRTMTAEIAEAVNRAAIDMQQTLIAQITTTLDQVTQKLQIRIERGREVNETLIGEIQKKQDAFQAEMLSTVSSLKYPTKSGVGGAGFRSESEGIGSGGHFSSMESGAHGGIRGKAGRDKEKFDEEAGRGGSETTRSNWKYRKLDLPKFDGENPDGWILRAERYFNFYQLSDEEKLEAAVVGFEGDALVWYQWEHRRRPIRKWEDMRSLILHQFRPLHSGTLCEQWLAVKQTGTVAEFRRKFIELAAPLEHIPETMMLAHFVNGLKDEIKAEVRMLGLYTLEQAMELALKVEEKNRVSGYGLGGNMVSSFASHMANSVVQLSGNSKGTNHSYPPSILKAPVWGTKSDSGSTSPSSWSQNSISPTGQGSPKDSSYSIPTAKPIGEIKRLTPKELQHKRERGLCFRCDEKWMAGHRCKQKELSVLLTQEEDEDGDSGEEEAPVVADAGQSVTPEVSLNSVVGISSPKTLRLKGLVAGEEVVCMIDPGATHNFVSIDLVNKLKLPMIETKEFGVSLGNGE